MPWVPRGLRDGKLTTGWPRRPDPYFDGFTAAVTVRDDAPRMSDAEADAAARVCPTGAIAHDQTDQADTVLPSLDRGKCILCGRCVLAFPQAFAWKQGAATAMIDRRALVVGDSEVQTPDDLQELRDALAIKVKHLGRSVHVRHVDAGSDGSDEWEVQALVNPVYDIHRLGVFFTASPRHADILLVTGIGTAGMVEPLRRTREAMPEPVVVIATGTDAVSGGLIGRGGYTSGHGVDELLGVDERHGVDVWVPGAPASPFTLMHAILLAIDRLPNSRATSPESGDVA
jgi:Ni,Fe-hydrogenase III small subunit/ferredoxin